MSVAASYFAVMPGAVAGMRCAPARGRPLLVSSLCLALALSVGLWDAARACLADETNSPSPAPGSAGDSNTQALLQTCLQLQEQLRATQLAIEQNRQEIKEAASRNADALSQALQTIQERFAAQQARDLEAIQAANKIILLVVSAFAAMGFLTLLMMTYFQWRMSKGLAQISAAVPAALGLGTGPVTGALGPVAQPGLRLTEAMHHLAPRVPESPPSPPPAFKPYKAPYRAGEPRLVPDPVASLRRGRIRPVRAAVIVGLICAGALALLFYLVTYSKLGFGYFHDLFRG